MSGERSV
jgi:hypothetical protein